MEDKWIHVSEVVVDDSVNTIHCDTRDFHCLVLQDKIDLRDNREPQISKCLYKDEYNISEKEIITWLTSIENMSGGKCGWRMLSFDGIAGNSWLKYIRLYHNPKKDGCFIVCDRDKRPIKWKDCNKENFVEELCMAHD